MSRDTKIGFMVTSPPAKVYLDELNGVVMWSVIWIWGEIMSIFEAGMLLCFGASWPFSVYKTWKAKTNKGKSLIFLWLVLFGYGCGITHKLLYSRDLVIAIYLFNAALVLADIVLCTIYLKRDRRLVVEVQDLLGRSGSI